LEIHNEEDAATINGRLDGELRQIHSAEVIQSPQFYRFGTISGSFQERHHTFDKNPEFMKVYRRQNLEL
jgi:hypothetical protein